MLETPKAQGATDATIPVDEAKAEMDNQQVTQLEIGWLAGIIDGEGYIGIQSYKTRRGNPSYSTEVSVSNTDEKLILRVRDIMLKIGVVPYINSSAYKLKHKPKHKNVWKIVVHRMAKNIRLLEVIVNHLTGIKKERGELVLEFCKSRLNHYIPGSHQPNILTDREIEIIEACIAKQKRGTSETIRKAQMECSEIARIKNESRRHPRNGRYTRYTSCDDRVQPFAKA